MSAAPANRADTQPVHPDEQPRSLALPGIFDVDAARATMQALVERASRRLRATIDGQDKTLLSMTVEN